MVMLAHKYKNEDPAGWWMSEKLDGVRAICESNVFYSRTNKPFSVPEDWKLDLSSKLTFDGEFWIGRGRFQETVSVVRRKHADPQDWLSIKYVIFELVDLDLSFEERHELLHQHTTSFPPWVEVLSHKRCKGNTHLYGYFTELMSLGAEGVMLSVPNSKYSWNKRSHDLLKLKQIDTDEAIVTGYTAGEGRHLGRLGALECRLSSGIEFKLGTGLTDSEREDPPPVGSCVTFNYLGLTKAGVPRCPSYLTIRDYE